MNLFSLIIFGKGRKYVKTLLELKHLGRQLLAVDRIICRLVCQMSYLLAKHVQYFIYSSISSI